MLFAVWYVELVFRCRHAWDEGGVFQRMVCGGFGVSEEKNVSGEDRVSNDVRL